MSTNRKPLSVLLISLLLILPISLTWLSSRKESESQPIRPTFTPFISVPYFNVTIPQKALMKNYLTVSAEAAPETNCTLTFIPPSGDIRQMDTIASQNGFCTWKWKIEEAYGAGDARLIFTINGVSDTHFIQIFKEF